MSISIRMPAMSPSMEKGNIARWLKKEGDEVRIGDVLAEIESDKAVMEMEAFDAGTLSRIVVPEGSQDVAVDEVIAILSPAGVAAVRSVEPKAERPSQVSETAPAVKEVLSESAPAPVDDLEQRIFASPLARRLARDAGVDLAGVTGSGPHGRIISRDLPDLARARPAAAQGTEAAAARTVVEPIAGIEEPKRRDILAIYKAGTFEYKRVDTMRRTIARRLVEAKQTIPHFYLSADCDVDALFALRAQVNQAFRPGAPPPNITINDFIIKAFALALRHVPEANTVWIDEQWLSFAHSDIGVVVAVEGGLYTPVVRNAETKSVSTISAEVKAYAARARDRSLRQEDLIGGSAAISNLGMYGVSHFQPIINPPHSLMLGVGAAEQRVVARDGLPSIIRSFTATLSCDHRAVDGVVGAQLLTEFKRLIEKPVEMLI